MKKTVLFRERSRASDGNRTRVSYLGKVVRNHYATDASNTV